MNFDEVINRRRSESYKWREYPEDVLPLFVADMDFRSPEPVARALGAYVDEGIFGYPRGLHSHDRAQVHELAALVVDRMAHRYKWQIAADDVIAIPGVVPGLNIACRSLREGSVLVQPPVYPPVLAAPKNSNLQLVESPLHCQDDGSYSIDWDSFRSGVAQNTRLFILCNPHNPVGRVFRRNELERMAEICLSDRESTRLNSSHRCISYAVFCLKKNIAINASAAHIDHGTRPPGVLDRVHAPREPLPTDPANQPRVVPSTTGRAHRAAELRRPAA